MIVCFLRCDSTTTLAQPEIESDLPAPHKRFILEIPGASLDTYNLQKEILDAELTPGFLAALTAVVVNTVCSVVHRDQSSTQ
ncbi:hypothetical protein RRG08_048253, partial [Elysia crispata]